MPVTPLQFYHVGSYPYPVATSGAGSAMAVCLYNNEPVLAILTQTSYEDEIVYLSLNKSISEEQGRVTVATPNVRIEGLCYNKNSNMLWATQGNYNPDNQGHRLVSLDPDSGLETGSINVPLDSGYALAWNGLNFVRSTGAELELISGGGNILASMTLNFGEACHGISASPWSYVASYGTNRPLVVINLFGNIIGDCPGVPGSTGGIRAVAFDNVRSFESVPQIPSESGGFSPEGSIHDPEVDWSPVPWKFRHRIYLANETDQMIYFGYLHE